jgi:hypothetical protein
MHGFVTHLSEQHPLLTHNVSAHFCETRLIRIILAIFYVMLAAVDCEIVPSPSCWVSWWCTISVTFQFCSKRKYNIIKLFKCWDDMKGVDALDIVTGHGLDYRGLEFWPSRLRTTQPPIQVVSVALF